jgi:hypothetical protein
MEYILFKNVRGATKLNLHLSKAINSFAEISDELATIIQYITTENNYNWTLSSQPYESALTLDVKALNLDYIYNQVNN